MAFINDLKQVGFSANQLKHLGDTASAAVAATGTTQGAAKLLTSSINKVTTATGGANDAVKLPSIIGWPLSHIFIFNGSGATIQIFPASGENIGIAGANTAVNLANNAGMLLFKIDTTNWVMVY